MLLDILLAIGLILVLTFGIGYFYKPYQIGFKEKFITSFLASLAICCFAFAMYILFTKILVL